MLARRISPPRPVWIDLDALVSYKRGLGPGADKVPMVVHAHGVELDRLVAGMQLAWLRSDRGQWLGCPPGLRMTVDRSSVTSDQVGQWSRSF
ncbi:hypothetical protein SAMN05216215_10458 [Saccharopolyspora shandongensis]|uniref:Uncharacterized protein n=1 Tax=Saccharopolyspora shandongensis TaxID=418495 RepID=A0A1H3Q1S4_9PSEU|nr:hypothetical protein [Saccharopolyspora shandongensis]SDZ06985.1 hypothetical protein SAMN05216215_10458 [Saccharopolyspora shandongensis]